MAVRFGDSGKFLRERRQALGLSVDEVAQRINRPVKTVENWEDGHSRPQRTLPELAQALELSEAELAAGIEQKRKRVNGGDYGIQPEEMKLGLGTLIERRRVERGWTRDQLAEKVGVSFSAIKDWEEDRYRPRIHLEELSEALGIDMGTLESLIEPDQRTNPKFEDEPVVVAVEQSRPAPKPTNGNGTTGTKLSPIGNIRPAPTTEQIEQAVGGLWNGLIRTRLTILQGTAEIRGMMKVARLVGDERTVEVMKMVEEKIGNIEEAARELGE